MYQNKLFFWDFPNFCFSEVYLIYIYFKVSTQSFFPTILSSDKKQLS